MTFDKWFHKLPRLAQLLLLLIPGVNWVIEILVRVSALLRKPGLINLLGFIFGVCIPVIAGWVDLVWVLLFKKLFLQD